jgi:hypothetical protein
MKPLFGVRLVVLIQHSVLFCPPANSEHHGVSAGDVHLGVTTEHSDRVPYALSIVVVVVGAGLRFGRGKMSHPSRLGAPLS